MNAYNEFKEKIITLHCNGLNCVECPLRQPQEAKDWNCELNKFKNKALLRFEKFTKKCSHCGQEIK